MTSDEVAAEKRKQQIHMVQTYFAQHARLNNVAHRMTVANRADCMDEVAGKLGLHAITAGQLPPKFREAAIEALSLSQTTPTVVSVVEGGPAAKAGILPGDEIVAFDDESVPVENGPDWVASYLKKAGERKIRVEVRRAGQSQTRVVQTVSGCSVSILLATDEQPNAFTDGKRIVVHTGILRIAPSDAELAVIVGHELAHVTMGHIKKREQNQVAGAIGGVAVDIGLALLGVHTGGAFTRGLGDAGGLAYVTEFEREADYVGTYYVARAGYDGTGIERFWRAMAQENPKQIFYAGLHPTSPERFLLMQKTNEEIADKKRRRVPLTPEAKVPPVTTAQASESASN